MMHRATLAFLTFLAPLVAAATWWIRRINRDVATAQLKALPFAPSPVEPALQGFSGLAPVERMYLHRQLRMAFFLFPFAAWLFTFILGLPVVLPADSSRWFNASALLWFQFLLNSSNFTEFVSMALLGCVFWAITPLRFGPEARFYRTRPVALGFLFWTRVLTTLVPVLLAAATAIGAVFLLLLALHGPVWRGLPAHIPRALGPDDQDLVQDYSNLLLTSAPRIFLSILTTLLLFMTALLALAMVPLLRGRRLGAAQTVAPIKLLLVMAAFPLFLAFTRFESWHGPAILFVYVNLGPPPPYLLALVPVALAAGCLALARVFVKHLEV